jgi:hypothetical protein
MDIIFISLIIAIAVTVITISIIIYFIHELYPLKPQFTNINTDCKYRRFGCCKDKITPKLDFMGSNCRGF